MSERDKLAKLLFITDNRSAKDPEMEWQLALVDGSQYVYAMADAMIAAGYRNTSDLDKGGELPPGLREVETHVTQELRPMSELEGHLLDEIEV